MSFVRWIQRSGKRLWFAILSLTESNPCFAVNAENGYGFTEESKNMLNSTHGNIPWMIHITPNLSMTDGKPDGRWLFINSNNTPRIARIDLSTFRTAEIIEIPNSGGCHASPFTTENTDYVVAATRFSVPIEGNKDVPINTYKENFKGTLTFVKVDKTTGNMGIGFQILMPGFDYDLAHWEKGPSSGWFFFSCYNSEQAHTLLEANASQNDKDFYRCSQLQESGRILAQEKRKRFCKYYHNTLDEKNIL